MEFIEKLDSMIGVSDNDDVKNFIEDSLEEAILSKRTDLIIVILNEGIGFFRETTDFDTLDKYVSSLINLINRLDLSDETRFICFINIANAYRAMSLLDLSKDYFNKALKLGDLEDVKKSPSYARIADLYNNLALLYQELKEYENSIVYLKKSLNMLNDKYKIAVCNTNLSISSLKLKKYDDAYKYLLNAKDIYDLDIKKEYHYSGFLHAYATYFEETSNIDFAIKYYEETLSYMEESFGHNKIYYDTYNHLKELYNSLGLVFHTPGLKLKHEYFNECFKPFLETLSEDEKTKLVIGSFFFGSELEGFDDDISEDHDFTPDFTILIKECDEELFKKVEEYYKAMPKHYKRYFIKDSKRYGVYYIEDYFKNINVYDFKNINEESYYFIKKYEIFYDLKDTYKSILSLSINNYEYNYPNNLSKDIIEVVQISEYNLSRMNSRNDKDSVLYLKSLLLHRLIKLYYRLIHEPYVETKWAYKRITLKKRYKWLKDIINKALNNNLDDDDILSLSKNIVHYLYTNDLIDKVRSDYVLDYQYEILENIKEYYDKYDLVYKIVDVEWNMFDKVKNIDGRADCQDNFEYFSLMRRSQYFTWPTNLLMSYLNDLNKGINLIELKYAYMEKTTDPYEYLKIKDKLPKIDSKREAIQEEVIKIVLESLEEFLKSYPKAKEQIRVIYTKDDEVENTSYETYLRGELSTYSINTLILYARFIVDLKNRNLNIPFKTFAKTSFFSGIDLDIYK